MNVQFRRALAALVVALGLSVEVAAQERPSQGPSMAFQPGLGEGARERIPGGRLVVGAYAAALALLGVYVAAIARKAAHLGDELTRLEDDLERHRARQEEAPGPKAPP